MHQFHEIKPWINKLNQNLVILLYYMNCLGKSTYIQWNPIFNWLLLLFLPDNGETEVTPKDFPDTELNEYMNAVAARGQETSIAFKGDADKQYMNVNVDVETSTCFTRFFSFLDI